MNGAGSCGFDGGEVPAATTVGRAGTVAGGAAKALAAAAPERIGALVLFGTFARMLADPDYPFGWTPEFFTRYKDELEQGWATGRGLLRSVPSAGPDEAIMEWLSRLLRLSASPADLAAAGFDAYHPKPVDFPRLLEQIDEALLGRDEP